MVEKHRFQVGDCVRLLARLGAGTLGWLPPVGTIGRVMHVMPDPAFLSVVYDGNINANIVTPRDRLERVEPASVESPFTVRVEVAVAKDFQECIDRASKALDELQRLSQEFNELSRVMQKHQLRLQVPAVAIGAPMPKAHQFNIGDSVRLLRDLPEGDTQIPRGTTGRVRRIMPDPAFLAVTFYGDLGRDYVTPWKWLEHFARTKPAPMFKLGDRVRSRRIEPSWPDVPFWALGTVVRVYENNDCVVEYDCSGDKHRMLPRIFVKSEFLELATTATKG